MEVRYLILLFHTFRCTIANLSVSIQRGDEALAGREEKDIPSHRFPPDPNNDRKICFRGEYLSIFNQETEDRKTFVERVVTDTEYVVPAGYTVYVRGATVHFTQP